MKTAVNKMAQACTHQRPNRSNLHSPTTIACPCCVSNLDIWFRNELEAVARRCEREIILAVYQNLSEFVRWPNRAILLWPGRDRRSKYHQYPASIKLMALQADIVLDGRVNGPAVAAYQLAGGERPERTGSNNCWSVHHVYSGKFAHPEHGSTLHAARNGLHCTQSAGLVAIHPIADQMCDEYPSFAWLLRAKAFEKFRYDPDHVFVSRGHDRYGFVEKPCFVVPVQDATAGKGE